jgi:FMN reductase [NAD(P)H]
MDVMQLLKGRRTYRRFDQSRPVPEAALQDMAQAVRLSSSARNLQLLRVIFVTDRELSEAMFDHVHFAADLPRELGTPKPGEHPVMYAVLIDTQKTRWTDTDAGILLSNLTLAAWAHGVGSCIMGNIDRKAIADLLNVPDPAMIHSAVALGYPTHTSEVVDLDEKGSLNYYLDEEKNYKVPKRPVSELIYKNKYPNQ